MKRVENSCTEALIYLSCSYVFQYDVRCELVEFFKNENNILCKYVSLDEFFKIFVLEEEINHRQLVNLKSLKREILDVRDTFTMSLKLTNKFGDTHYEFSGVAIKDAGQIQKVVCKIAIIEDPNKKPSDLFYIDSLTATLANDSIINYAKNQLSQGGTSTTFMIVDIDNFNTINDLFGHLEGDKILSSCATALKNALEFKGEIGRIGGDEFLIVLKGASDYKSVWENARRIRSSIEKLKFKEYHDLQITCTIGTSTFPADGDSFEILFKKADRALYRGKAKGRNCFIIYNEVMHGKISDDDHYSFGTIKQADTSSINSLISSAFNITSNKNISPQEKESMLLQLTGMHFALDRILVFDLNTDNTMSLKNKYISSIYPQFSSPNMLYVHSAKDIEKSLNADISIINIVDNFVENNHELCNSLMTRNVKSTVICRLIANEKTLGYVFFEMCSKRRMWQYSETNMFLLIANILASIKNL